MMLTLFLSQGIDAFSTCYYYIGRVRKEDNANYII